jgi:hypothetical protein
VLVPEHIGVPPLNAIVVAVAGGRPVDLTVTESPGATPVGETVTAATTVIDVDVCFLLVMPTAKIVWDPPAADGTTIGVVNAPLAVAVVVARLAPSDALSQRMVTRSFRANPWPVTEIDVPTAPEVGLAAM